MDRPAVLHLFAPAPFGGLEQVVRALALEQTRAGLVVHVGAVLESEAQEHPVLEELRSRGIPVHEVRRPHRRYLRERRMIAGICRRVQPRVVHTHGYHADVLHGPVARRLGLATVSTVHGFTGGGWKNRFYEWLQRRAYRRCDAVVAVSRPMIARLEAAGVSSNRLHCVPNALAEGNAFLDRAEARQRLSLAPEGFVAGFVGRLSQEKGADVFVDALGTISDRDIGAVVIGGGRLRGEMGRRAVEYGLASIRWAGVVDGAAALMRALDVVVLSSRTEGAPIVLLEAMAAGVPVVATTVGGIPYVVSEREALLVPPEDPGRLGAAILDVLERPEQAAERAAAAATRLRMDFGPDAWVERYNDVYRACGCTAAEAGP